MENSIRCSRCSSPMVEDWLYCDDCWFWFYRFACIDRTKGRCMLCGGCINDAEWCVCSWNIHVTDEKKLWSSIC